MDLISTAIGAFEYLGITKERVIPNLIMSVIVYWLLAKKVDKFNNTLERIKQSILEIHTTLKAKLKVDFDQTIDKYGQANSPMVLKDEFKQYVTKTSIETQVENKRGELINWLKEQKPDTGIDAQDRISNLVISGEIEKFLDLTQYKQYLYKKGKTLKDMHGILTVYLFEKLIPKIFSDIE